MKTTQKALIVRTGPDGHDGLEALNIELERGWRVAEVAPMGGAGGATSSPVVAALVILEHRDERPEAPVSTAEAVEESTDEAIEEILTEGYEVTEGDGAGTQRPLEPPPFPSNG
jgi:hypothetical protein